MLFGIRPEDLFLPGQLRNGANIAEIDMKVSGVEALGAETVLIFEVEGLHQAIFVKADRFTRARRGDRIRVTDGPDNLQTLKRVDDAYRFAGLPTDSEQA